MTSAERRQGWGSRLPTRAEFLAAIRDPAVPRWLVRYHDDGFAWPESIPAKDIDVEVDAPSAAHAAWEVACGFQEDMAERILVSVQPLNDAARCAS